MAVTAVEAVSTVEAVMVVAATTEEVDSAAATGAEVTATVAGERVRATPAGDMEGCEAVAQRMVLKEGEVRRRVEVLPADGQAGVETEGTFRALPTGSGIRSGPLAPGLRRFELVASADRLTGMEGITAGTAAIMAGMGGITAGTAGMAGEDVGDVAGDLGLDSELAGGRVGVLFGIGRRMGIALGGVTGIRLTFIRTRELW